MNTTLTTVLYTSKTLSDGTHPLLLRLTKNRRIKYISLHISLDAKFWDFDKGRPKRNCPDKERINALIETKTKELQEQILDFKTNDKEYTLSTLVDKASRKAVRVKNFQAMFDVNKYTASGCPVVQNAEMQCIRRSQTTRIVWHTIYPLPNTSEAHNIPDRMQRQHTIRTKKTKTKKSQQGKLCCDK